MVRIAAVILVVAGITGCAGIEEFTGNEPIIDTQGVDLASLEQDKLDCQAYADQVQVGRQTAVAAGTGAVLGGVIGGVFGNSSTAKRGASAGAASGAVQGAGGGLRDRQQVIRNCLLGRGYRVLN
ncbi:MAG: glycine zipper family protein [Pseudomonadota bacterium]